MDPSQQKETSNGTTKVPDSDEQESSDLASNSSENILNLNKRFDSSLQLGDRSRSEDRETSQSQYNISRQIQLFSEKLSYRRPRSKEDPCSYGSSKRGSRPNIGQKSVDCIPSFCQTTVKTKQYAFEQSSVHSREGQLPRRQQPSFHSRNDKPPPRPSSYPNMHNRPSSGPARYRTSSIPPRQPATYQTHSQQSATPTHRHQGTKPAVNQTRSQQSATPMHYHQGTKPAANQTHSQQSATPMYYHQGTKPAANITDSQQSAIPMHYHQGTKPAANITDSQQSAIPMHYHQSTNPAANQTDSQQSATSMHYHHGTNPVHYLSSANPDQSNLDPNTALMGELDDLLHRCQTVLFTMDRNAAYRSQFYQPIYPEAHASQHQVPSSNDCLAPHQQVPTSQRTEAQCQVPTHFIRTNAGPIRLGQLHQTPAPQFYCETTGTLARYAPPLPAPVPGNLLELHDSPPEVIQNRFDLTPEMPDQIFSLPLKWSEETEDQTSLKSPTTKEEEKRLQKLQELANRSSPSKKSLLCVGIPKQLPPSTYFPSYLPPEGGRVLRPLLPDASLQPQRTSSSGYFSHAEPNPQNQWLQVEPFTESAAYCYPPGQLVPQYHAVPQSETQYGVPVHSAPYIDFSVPTPVQSQVPYSMQQPIMYNSYATTQFQDPNQIMYPYGMQMILGSAMASDSTNTYPASGVNFSYIYEPNPVPNVYGGQTSASYQSSTNLDQASPRTQVSSVDR